MNKFGNTLKCLVVIAFAIIFFCGCSKYNYPNIFPFDNAFYKRAEKINEINGYEAFMSNIEFEKMKVAFRKQGFVDWKDIGDACFYSNGKAVNISSLGKSHDGVFSINYSSRLEGELPVIIYFHDIGKVVILIADGFGM